LIADSARTGQRDGAIARIVLPLPARTAMDSATKDATDLAVILQRQVRDFVSAN
jgi:hypothetical protein